MVGGFGRFFLFVGWFGFGFLGFFWGVGFFFFVSGDSVLVKIGKYESYSLHLSCLPLLLHESFVLFYLDF